MDKRENNEVTLDDILEFNTVINNETNNGNSSDKQDSVIEEKDKKVEYIPNPLPVPKRREHRAMDYTYKIDENDDFDIKDMTGMDFFDYE